MKITVKLDLILREGRFREAEFEYPPESRISDVMEKLKIPKNGVAAIMINDTEAKPEQKLQNGDELTLLTFVAGG